MSVITISCLGNRGRVGNALFQYCAAKGYARAVGATLQTPDWWGRKIFPVAAADPLIDQQLPRTLCDSVCGQKGYPIGYWIGKTNIDLFSYFQHQIFLNFYTRKDVREWLTMKPEFENHAPPIQLYYSSDTNSHHNDYSAWHVRKGDYTTDPTFQRLYATITRESYIRALDHFNIPVPMFEVYEGWRPEPLELKAQGLGWLPDFLFMRDASYLLRANSTFSWWAGTLGRGKVYSPVVGSKVGVQDIEFVESNWPCTAGIFPNQTDLTLREE